MAAARATLPSMSRTVLAALATLAALSSGASSAAAASPTLSAGGVRLAAIGTFASPTFATAPVGDRRVFVVEQGGGGAPARIVVADGARRRVFLDLTPRVASGSEQGLLSMAFAPDYRASRRFYVFYTRRVDNAIQIDEFRRSRVDPNRALVSSRRSILTDPHPTDAHNGGQLAFGPDGYLYASIGDANRGAQRGDAQNLGLLLGKLIRIDPRRPSGGRQYGIPPGNPFAGMRGARPEIWALGLRNPWRFSFDRRTGDLALGDVGQEQTEEVDVLPAGRGAGSNFGWGRYQGFDRYSDVALNPAAPTHAPPILTFPHAPGSDCTAVTGGYVVRDRSLPRLAGRYLFGEFCSGGIRLATLRAPGPVGSAPTGLAVPGLVSFGEDGACRILVAGKYAGRVYRLVPARPPAASGCQR